MSCGMARWAAMGVGTATAAVIAILGTAASPVAASGSGAEKFPPGTYSVMVPPGVTAATVIAEGGLGHSGLGLAHPGSGGRVSATIPVVACTRLTVNVGSRGGSQSARSGGSNGGGTGGAGVHSQGSGGGGGGATDILDAHQIPLIVAGGGGGGGGSSRTVGGHGGWAYSTKHFATPAGAGVAGMAGLGAGSDEGGGGHPGTGVSAGLGGRGGPGSGPLPPGGDGGGGVGRVGGAGGNASSHAVSGGGGGGGGGFFGGGGGGGGFVSDGGGGGGGSDFVVNGSTHEAFFVSVNIDGVLYLTFHHPAQALVC
jgi:hypothetical protein